MKLLIQQYKMVKSARTALFSYLDTIPFYNLRQPFPTYNNASICYLSAHVADVYLFWINEFSLTNQAIFNDPAALQSIADIAACYSKVDECMNNFFNNFAGADVAVEGFVRHSSRALKTNVLQLFAHVITHEFHHKGQIVNMGRQLGFTPVDTDIIRS